MTGRTPCAQAGTDGRSRGWVDGGVRRTWRGRAARVQYYFLEGSNALTQVKQVVYVCAALRVLEVPMGWVVACAPLVYGGQVLAGWGWVRWGWFKQLQEVPTTDAVNPIVMWHTHMLVRLYEHVGIPVDGMDLGEMPGALKGVVTSYRRG